jgi:hypothetical protein
MKSLRVALIVPAVLLSACAFAQTAGNGVSREDTRQVGDFTGVEVQAGLKAKVSVGPKSVSVSGDENLVALVQTEVEDDKLVVKLQKGARVRGTSGLRITITSPQVKSVGASGGAEVEVDAGATDSFAAAASGGSDIAVRGLDTKSLAVDASGGSEVKVQGRANALAVEASGGSEVHGKELSNLKSLAVEASGGSQVDANPAESLAAELSGGSTLEVDSSPAQRAVETSGGSQVVFSKK